VDFGALPPEINSGRMYMGAGPGPLVAAAAAWDGLAAELSSAAGSYQAAIEELTSGEWLGAASVSMAAAAVPYVEWMNATAIAAEQTANQARSAAAAYEAAFSATVPPPVIAANRALLMALVATNILGQNTSAIADTEAQYGEMWAQDAAAMYGYAGSSAAATTLTPFSTPKQNTNPAGTSTQAAAVGQAVGTSTGTTGLSQLLSTVPKALQGLAAGGSADPMASLLNLLNSPLGSSLNSFSNALSFPINSVGSGGSFLGVDAIYMAAPIITAAFPGLAPAAAVAAPAVAASDVSGVPAGAGSTLVGSYGSGGAEVSAGLGRAASVGGLSVPQSWGSAAPEIRLAARGLPMAGLDEVPQAGAARSGCWFGGMPPIGPVGGLVNAPRNGDAGFDPRSRRGVIPQLAKGGSLLAGPPDPPPTPTRRVSDVVGQLSERERYELDELRKDMAELAMDRDAFARLIKEAIRP
jgi:PPE-repeat protein